MEGKAVEDYTPDHLRRLSPEQREAWRKSVARDFQAGDGAGRDLRWIIGCLSAQLDVAEQQRDEWGRRLAEAENRIETDAKLLDAAEALVRRLAHRGCLLDRPIGTFEPNCCGSCDAFAWLAARPPSSTT